MSGSGLASDLRQRFERRAATVGVIGMGYVGLPLALAAGSAGFRVLGFDTDPQKVELLNAGHSPLAHIGNEPVAQVRATGQLEATADFSQLGEPDAILICVPTPLGRHREPDLSFVEETCRTIARYLRPGQLVVLESTTYPGTTREVVKPILESSGLQGGIDFYIAYSPEREDPGNREFTISRIPKLVGGDNEVATELACALYQQFVCKVVPVSGPDVAEAAKLTENIFRAVNIALVNELKIIFHRMGIDIFEVIRAAATKPFGYMPFWPGPGLGGHCIPIDPFYLAWRAREFGLLTRFIELAGEINTMMPEYVVGRLAEELDRRFGKGLNGSRILLVGIAYKKNVDDMRESPALTIWELLEARGATVEYYDPHIPVVPMTRRHPTIAGRRSVGLDEATLRMFDAVVVVTDHDAVDWPHILREARLVLDTRDVAAGLVATDRVARA